MATQDELNRQKQFEKNAQRLNDLEKQRKEILSGTESVYKRSVDDAAENLDLARQLVEELKEQAGMRRGAGEQARSQVNLVKKLADAAGEVTSAIGAEAEVAKQLNRDRELSKKLDVEIANARKALAAQGIDQQEAANDLVDAERSLNEQLKEERRLREKLADLKDTLNIMGEDATPDLKKDVLAKKAELKNDAFSRARRELVSKGFLIADDDYYTLGDKATFGDK